MDKQQRARLRRLSQQEQQEAETEEMWRLALRGLLEVDCPSAGLNHLVLGRYLDAGIREVLRACRTHLRSVRQADALEASASGEGVKVLCHGPPGAGKSVVVEALTGDLGVPLCRLLPSGIMSSAVGESEKSVRRVFSATVMRECVVFLDQCAVLLEARTPVRDGFDRHANALVEAMVGELERFDGIFVVETDRPGKLDRAFTSLCHFAVEFRLPDHNEQVLLWRKLSEGLLDLSQIDLDRLVRRCPATGGRIKRAVLRLHCVAGSEHRPIVVTQEDLERVLNSLPHMQGSARPTHRPAKRRGR